MPDEKQPVTDQDGASTSVVEEESWVRLYQMVDAEVPVGPVGDPYRFIDEEEMVKADRGALFTVTFKFLLDQLRKAEKPIEQVDGQVVDRFIAEIDMHISAQLDVILHHEKFQSLESAWRSLKVLVDKTASVDGFRNNVQIELLNGSKDAMYDSIKDNVVESPLYKTVYRDAYDTPGAAPFSLIVSNYEFENTNPDIRLMTQLSKVAASAHCPFLGAAGTKFWGVKSFDEWKEIPDATAHMAAAEYTKWRSFRSTEDSRYVALTFPRFMLRLPYGPETEAVRGFNYVEDVKATDHEKYLWGNSSFALASNMVAAFVEDGLCLRIRGSQLGGRVRELPVHVYNTGKGPETKIPTEVLLDDQLELECSELGFAPLAVYKDTDYAVFFSVNTSQKPQDYGDRNKQDAFATANAKLNAQLPYIMIVSRFAHYLKVLQRENIGQLKGRDMIQEELGKWIGDYVYNVPKPDPKLIARRPLRGAEVEVDEIPAKPGFYKVQMKIEPWLQLEGMDVSIALVSSLNMSE